MGYHWTNSLNSESAHLTTWPFLCLTVFFLVLSSSLLMTTMIVLFLLCMPLFKFWKSDYISQKSQKLSTLKYCKNRTISLENAKMKISFRKFNVWNFLSNTQKKRVPVSFYYTKKGTIFKTVPHRHCFGWLFFLSDLLKINFVILIQSEFCNPPHFWTPELTPN